MENNPHSIHHPSAAGIHSPSGAGSVHAPATPEALDAVYRSFLDALRLSSAHRANLVARGLSAIEIDRRLYRTVPGRTRCSIVSRLASKFTDEVLAAIPGFFYDSMNSRWSCSGTDGFFIPVRNATRQIVALQIRLDNPGNQNPINRGDIAECASRPAGRYVWFSSSKHGGSPIDPPIHFPGTDIDIHALREIRVTEGCLKADIATVLSNTYTIGLPSCGQWKKFMESPDGLPGLPAVEKICIAFDADARSNIGVAGHLMDFVKELMNIAGRDNGYTNE